MTRKELEARVQELEAFQAEVLGVCASARVVLCPSCGGAGARQGLHRDANGSPMYCYYESCEVCDGKGFALP